VGRGWLERAHRLLDPLPVAAEHGWLALIDTDFALNVDRDLDAALDLARKAGELGRRFGVADLEAVGLGQEELALVCRGSVEEGMGHSTDERVVSGHPPRPIGVGGLTGEARAVPALACSAGAARSVLPDQTRAVISA
jgi:hypothetical protein